MDSLQILARNLLLIAQKQNSIILNFDDNRYLVPSQSFDTETSIDLRLSPVSFYEVNCLIQSLGYDVTVKSNNILEVFLKGENV